MLEHITPLILTYNESSNINRALEKLDWAKQIIVIDSFSTDNTLDILRSYPQVVIFQRKFDTHALQWNYGIEQARTDWILSLDADYCLTDELIQEMETLTSISDINSYVIRFKYCVFGKPLRGTLLPPRHSLFRKDKSIYVDDGHTQLLQVEGKSDQLSAYIYHDDRKSLGRWLWAQDRYMLIEVKKLLETVETDLSWGDRLRKRKILAPFVILFYCLIIKGGVLDGWRGWYYAFQRVLAEIILAVRLMEAEHLVPESPS